MRLPIQNEIKKATHRKTKDRYFDNVNNIIIVIMSQTFST